MLLTEGKPQILTMAGKIGKTFFLEMVMESDLMDIDMTSVFSLMPKLLTYSMHLLNF